MLGDYIRERDSIYCAKVCFSPHLANIYLIYRELKMCEYMYIFERVFSCFYAFYSPSRSRLALQVDSSFFSILLLTLLRFLSAIRISYLSLHDRSAGYIYIVCMVFIKPQPSHFLFLLLLGRRLFRRTYIS